MVKAVRWSCYVQICVHVNPIEIRFCDRFTNCCCEIKSRLIHRVLCRPAVFYVKGKCNCWSILFSFLSSKTPSNSLKFHRKRFHKRWSIRAADGRQQHEFWDLRAKPNETFQPSSKAALRFILFSVKAHHLESTEMLCTSLKCLGNF